MSSDLCDACGKIFQFEVEDCKDQYESRRNPKTHRVTPSDLHISSRSCRICKRLWEKSRQYLLERAGKQNARKYIELNSTQYFVSCVDDRIETKPRGPDDFDPPYEILYSSRTWLKLSFKWQEQSSLEPFDCYYLMASDSIRNLVGAYEPSTKVDAPSTWSLCRGWINNCLQNHTVCCTSSSQKARFYPTRLLKLTTLGDNIAVKLIITRYEQPQSPYMTLSHCWGATQVVKLSRKTFSELTSGLNVLQLPPLYQDAINICLRLDVQYLWIDSLCIIQDEPHLPGSDWMTESRLMGSIYENSHCNIAASEAADSLGRLLHNRTVTELRPREVTVGTESDRRQDFYLYPEELLEGRQGEPLSKRGWVLQEELLPPRALVFTKRQVHWECRMQEACESFPGGLPPTECGSGLSQTAVPARPKSQLKEMITHSHPLYFLYDRDGDKGLSPWLSFWYSWKCIVEDFTKRRITNSSDKLSAIAGLATKLSQGNQGYAAGMWNVSTTIAYELAWQVRSTSNGEQPCRPKVYRAPTWSWASMDGAIRYKYKADHYSTGDNAIAYVRTVEVTTVDGSITGPVKSGFIDIEGPLLQVNWDYQGTKYGPEDDDMESVSETLYALSLINQYTYQSIYGLTLRKIEGGPNDGCYRRVGTFTTVSDLEDMSEYYKHYEAPKTAIRIV